MKLFTRSIYFVCAFVLAAGVCLTFMNRAGLFKITDIPVSIDQTIESSGGARLAPVAGAPLKERIASILANLRGKKIWEVDIQEIRASVAKDEWVKDVFVSRSLPGSLRVEVQPRLVSLVLVNKKGEFFPVAEDGSLQSALPANQLPDVPFLRGDEYIQSRSKREGVIRFMSELPENGPLGRSNVSEIEWTDEDGFVLTIIQPKIAVKLGHEDFGMKVLRVTQVLNYLVANQLSGNVIDANFSKKVLVRLRKGP